jgi:hypothetical protein
MAIDAFKKLFGIEKSRVRPDCVLSPLNEVDLLAGPKAGERCRGDYFQAADCELLQENRNVRFSVF